MKMAYLCALFISERRKYVPSVGEKLSGRMTRAIAPRHWTPKHGEGDDQREKCHLQFVPLSRKKNTHKAEHEKKAELLDE